MAPGGNNQDSDATSSLAPVHVTIDKAANPIQAADVCQPIYIYIENARMTISNNNKRNWGPESY